MTKKKEQSAIDAIYEITETLSRIEKRMDVMDSNIKLLNNKVSKLSKIRPTTQSSARPSAGIPVGKSPVKENINTKEVQALIVGKIKAFGYIVNKSKQPIPDVVVNIYGDGSEVIRSLKTNIDGHWNARLPSGRYGVEYLHKKFKPINRTIVLEDSQVEYEVK